MPDHIILRIGRPLHSFGQIALVAGHNDRTAARPAASIESARSGDNLLLAGSGDSLADVRTALATLTKPPRANAVLAREVFIGASPSWWRQSTDGRYDRRQVEDFAARAMAWATTEWGKGQVVAATLHLDEPTAAPHMHIIVSPIVTKMVRKRGRKSKDGEAPPHPIRTLDNEIAFGTIEDFRRRQSDIARSFEDAGLVRGVEGSKAKHERPSHFIARRAAELVEYLNEVERRGRKVAAFLTVPEQTALAAMATAGRFVARVAAAAGRGLLVPQGLRRGRESEREH